MKEIVVPGGELFNSATNEFITVKSQTIRLEHSLVSLSKWEQKYKKSWVSKFPETYKEFVDYVRYMTLTQNVDPAVYDFLTKENIEEIMDYIKDPMTATTINSMGPKRPNRQIITSELVYYWMFSYGIPMECQKWHFNRLMTLIRIFSEENSPKKKMGQNELASRNHSLNAARRAALRTRG